MNYICPQKNNCYPFNNLRMMHHNCLRKAIRVGFIFLCIYFPNLLFAQQAIDTNEVKANINTCYDSITINRPFAKALATRMLEVSKKGQYPWGIFMNTHLLGMIAYNEAEKEKAIKMHEEALAYGRAHGFKQKESSVLSNLAKDYGGTGNAEKAINLYHEAVKVAHEVNDTLQVGQALQGLGQTYSRNGFPEEAITYCSQAAEIYVPRKKYALLKWAYNTIAASYMELSKFDSAYRYLWLTKLTSDSITKGALPGPDFYINMAVVSDSLLRPDSAAFYFKNALSASLRLNDEIGLQSSYSYLAMKELQAGNTAQAIDYYKKVLVLTEKYKNPEGNISTTNSLAKAYAKMGDYKNAYDYALKEAAYRDDYMNQEKINAVTALNAKFEKQQLQYEFDKKTAATELANQKKIAKRNMLLYGFIGLALLLAAVILFVVKYYRQKAVINANKNNELKQRLLLTQMNPHFIFNSVDNIQSLIHSKKDEEAINYLTKFSKLTRQILENSRENYISLSEELNMLDNYMTIQKLLYNNNFSYKVILDDNIDPETILLPPMLTQPFIENAIKHGLKGRTEGGSVSVRFYMDGGQLFFEVIDNGSGLVVKEQETGQKSLSTQITRERLASIASKKNIMIHTMNITGINNVIQGVKTFFEIPYVHNN